MQIKIVFVALLTFTTLAGAASKSVKVYVALCDNKTQGIAKVGAKIGDGNVPDANLYWGCSDGFGSYFKRSKRWKVKSSDSDISNQVLRKMTLIHVDGDVRLTAEAYRGSEMEQCMKNFERDAAMSLYDLVVFIGHNGLMDVKIPELEPISENETEVMVLSCLSEMYYKDRLTRLGCRPVLLTRQLMYPGSFLLHDALEVWKRDGSPAEMRAAAGKAYSKNQGISVKAGTGIFAELP